MGRLRVLVSSLVVSAALCVAASVADGPPATEPAGATTRPATRSAKAETPTIAPEELNRLVSRLSSDRYQVRQSARLELREIVDRPGAAELLQRHLDAAADPEVKAALEDIVGGYGQPLVMVWPCVESVATANSHSRRTLNPAAPWLHVKGDGSFIYAPAAFTSPTKAGTTRPTEWRRGRLAASQLWQLKKAIRDGAGAGLPQMDANARVTGVEVALYLRSGSRWRVSQLLWTAEALDPSPKRRGEADSNQRFLAFIRGALSAVASEPCQGRWCLHGEYAGAMRREEVAKLPDWPIAGVTIQTALAQGGVRLEEKQLKQVRALLSSEKGNVYKFAQFAACRVRLVPYIKEALEIHYGPGR